MVPYWRYAVELFPEFRKERIPVARFLCRQRQRTFSLLPVQLIPYFQYTVGAVMGTLLLGWGYWQRGQGGFWGASVEVDPDSLVTPWLVAFWLAAVLRGLRRSHAVLAEYRAHEHEHVRQYERWGVLFFFLYVGSSAALRLRGARPYWDNRFERQARAAQDRFTSTRSIR